MPHRVLWRVLWTDLSLTRIQEIADYIARERPGSARSFVKQIFERVDVLAEVPRSGRPYPNASDTDLRELIVDQYRVIYRIAEPERAIYILTIRHGRQRPLPPREL
jgi:toxin ParE1/3/4